MTLIIAGKLLAIVLAVALGVVAGRRRWLGSLAQDPARVLGNVAFLVFVPALLFRTTARLELAAMPWHTVAAFFVPTLALLLAVYAWQRAAAHRALRAHPGAGTGPQGPPPTAAATRAVSASFGNTVQVGIPLAAALFGEAGLGIHIALVSLHALVLLTVLTILAELDLARASAADAGSRAPLAATLASVARNTLVHPVVLPVLAGLLWNVSGLPLPAPVDELLLTLGQAVVPVCLLLIGVTLADKGLHGQLGQALQLSALKLLLLPACVLVVAHWGFGLNGLPLQVVVVMAALPTGSNALLFAQRYGALDAEANATIVVSTLAFVATLALWLVVLGWV